MSQQEKDTRQGQDTTLSGKQEGTTTLQNRRRLLKAAGMAPMIYTLPAGAQTAAGSISCVRKDGNWLEATRSGRNVESNDGTVSCTLPPSGGDGGVCTTDDGNGTEYIFEGNNRTGTLTARSCWNSLNPTG